MSNDIINLNISSEIINDTVQIKIRIHNKLKNDKLLIPISYWDIFCPNNNGESIPYDNDDSYGGYNMIRLYNKNKGIPYTILDPYCMFPRYFPQLIAISPDDTLLFELKLKSDYLKNKSNIKYLYSYIMINYIHWNEFSNNNKIKNYLNLCPYLIIKTNYYYIDIDKMVYEKYNLMNYRIINIFNEIDRGFRDTICKYLNNYIKANVKIGKKNQTFE